MLKVQGRGPVVNPQGFSMGRDPGTGTRERRERDTDCPICGNQLFAAYYPNGRPVTDYCPVCGWDSGIPGREKTGIDDLLIAYKKAQETAGFTPAALALIGWADYALHQQILQELADMTAEAEAVHE